MNKNFIKKWTTFIIVLILIGIIPSINANINIKDQYS